MATVTATKGTAVVTLPSDTEILITRTFNAPAHLIYKAWTTPELVSRWWVANRGAMKTTDIDLRVGGTWRWVMVAEGGFEVAFHGVYLELVPHERIVYTEVFEGVPMSEDDAAINTLTFTERDGKTYAELRVKHRIQEHRDMHIQSGMESGMQDALDLLEGVAIGLAA